MLELGLAYLDGKYRFNLRADFTCNIYPVYFLKFSRGLPPWVPEVYFSQHNFDASLLQASFIIHWQQADH